MAKKEHRVQAMLSDLQYERLQACAREQETTISALIREAVQQTYVDAAERNRRLGAYERLIALDLPVDDWDAMEREIEAGATLKAALGGLDSAPSRAGPRDERTSPEAGDRGSATSGA